MHCASEKFSCYQFLNILPHLIKNFLDHSVNIVLQKLAHILTNKCYIKFNQKHSGWAYYRILEIFQKSSLPG